MYVLDVKADGYNRMKFEVASTDAVAKMLTILFKLGVGVTEVTVTFRDEIPVEEVME